MLFEDLSRPRRPLPNSRRLDSWSDDVAAKIKSTTDATFQIVFECIPLEDFALFQGMPRVLMRSVGIASPAVERN